MSENSRSAENLVPRDLMNQVARSFKMLSEPVRLDILNHLHVEKELNVQQIVETTGHSQANVSKHLGLLSREGLVARRKEGLYVFYRIADPMLADICQAVCSRLKRRAEATYRSA
ncbi:MAG: metalloregulator ArsR/SmtB family transcription factor [Rhodothermales bacterium]